MKPFGGSEMLILKLNRKIHKLYYKGPDMIRKQVCMNYDVTSIMMVNSRVLEKFQN